jgi:uroporphyrinogen decarboxylase
MTSRERVLAAIGHEPVDRIPTDIWATEEVWAKLIDRFGDVAGVKSSLGIDGFEGANPAYAGPTLPADGSENYWGMRYATVEFHGGEYREQSVYPLAHVESIDGLVAYRWPDPDWFDYSTIRRRLELVHETRATQVGYMAPFYFHNQLRGLEASLMDPLIDPEFTHELLRRITDFFVEQHRRIFEAGEGLIDVTQVTDDFGSQHGPLISLEVFREFYRPQIQRCIDLAKEFGIRVMHHDDGAMSAFIPDLLEMGIEILNPVQWTCPGMEAERLKEAYGDRLCFHGGVENQRVLPFGSSDEVRAEVRHCIDALASDGTGYILAPCHNLQSITPMENILAMYDEARTYGARR